MGQTAGGFRRISALVESRRGSARCRPNVCAEFDQACAALCRSWPQMSSIVSEVCRRGSGRCATKPVRYSRLHGTTARDFCRNNCEPSWRRPQACGRVESVEGGALAIGWPEASRSLECDVARSRCTQAVRASICRGASFVQMLPCKLTTSSGVACAAGSCIETGCRSCEGMWLAMAVALRIVTCARALLGASPTEFVPTSGRKLFVGVAHLLSALLQQGSCSGFDAWSAGAGRLRCSGDFLRP